MRLAHIRQRAANERRRRSMGDERDTFEVTLAEQQQIAREIAATRSVASVAEMTGRSTLTVRRIANLHGIRTRGMI